MCEKFMLAVWQKKNCHMIVTQISSKLYKISLNGYHISAYLYNCRHHSLSDFFNQLYEKRKHRYLYHMKFSQDPKKDHRILNKINTFVIQVDRLSFPCGCQRGSSIFPCQILICCSDYRYDLLLYWEPHGSQEKDSIATYN